ncbi:MAG: hypothetical protein ABH815_02885 [Candidatus Omnitrophota bacterium]
MSIINDAIKKARKEFEVKNKIAAAYTLSKEVSPEKPQQAGSEVKWTIVVVASLVVTISLLGSITLYRQMSRSGGKYGPAISNIKSEASLPVFGLSEKKQPISGVNVRNVIELNGIVYGPEDKWAIINNKIVREGDLLLNGQVALIAKDFVKIEKDDGENIVLDLK